MNDYEPHVEVFGVKCNRNSDGDLDSVKVKVEYFEVSEPENEHEEPEFKNGESIRFKWDHNGYGELNLVGWKDASDDHAGWVNPRVLRCLPAATAAAENVPDVETADDVHKTLEVEIDLGIEAFHNAE